MKKLGFNIAENTGHYITMREVSEAEIIAFSKQLIAKRFKRGRVLSNPNDSRELFRGLLADKEQECFTVCYMDNRHRIIDTVTEFFGTVDQCSVHVRILVQRALSLNAASVVLGHPHPSGCCQPSQADKELTKQIAKALALIDVRCLDHLIVAGNEIFSFAEAGLM